jgi:serine/threonine protein kinase
MKDTLARRVRFAGFELDLKAGELRGGGETVRLPEKPLRVLLILVDHGGELVTREEIRKRLWPNDTVVDFEHGINTAIKQLRRVLGDSADEPKFIETVPRRGYRLLVPVELDAPIAAPTPSEPEPGRAATAGLIGKKVSHYRVLEVIGGGGMGVVYKAEDLKLGRRVALKFLPEELATDTVALQRFEREAQTASSLNHPNICTIYAIEEHEGQPFIVMELLEGGTLRERLAASQEALSFEELLTIALQVSDGLQAAHESGIIHRDIKPANIFLTSKGVCKILDFGLAKLLEAGSEGEAAAQPVAPGGPSLARSVLVSLSRAGEAMGTAGYMSPEQVRSEKLDARTDLFSFGLVVYEMATGQRAFSGETAPVVREAILYQPQVPVHDLNSKLPAELETIINKALEKDRERRYQSAAEMGGGLKQLKAGAESAKEKPKRYAQILLLGAAVLAIVVLGSGWRLRWFTTQQSAPVKLLSERQLTHIPTEIRLLDAAISPDGNHMAYIDSIGLHLSIIGAGEVHDLPLPEALRTHLRQVSWFPDGEKLILTADSDQAGFRMWVTSIFGESPRLLGRGWFPTVSPQGSLIAFISEKNHELWVMGVNGENPRRILSSENDAYFSLAWSPTGQRLAYVATAEEGTERWRIETVSLDGASHSAVVANPQRTHSLLWARDGRMIFVCDEGPLVTSRANLWEIMTDPEIGKPTGKAIKVTNWDGVHLYSATISRDASRVVVLKEHFRSEVYVGELKDGGTRVASPTRFIESESGTDPDVWLGDSKTILFSSNRTGRSQIFRQQIGQDTAQPVIGGPDEDFGANLSPDGRWILYWSYAYAGGGPTPTTVRLMRFPVSGGSPEQILETRFPDPTNFECPIRLAGSCVLSRSEQGLTFFYELDPVRGQGKELARINMGPGNVPVWAVSPEGSRLAIVSRVQPPQQVRIVDFRNGTEHNFELPQGWYIRGLGWAADGKALLATVQSTESVIARIEFDGAIHILFSRSRNQPLGLSCPSPDGRHLAFSQNTVERNAWLLENF